MALTKKPSHTSKAWGKYKEIIIKRDGYTCQMCGVFLRRGRKHPRSAVVDHKQPAKLRPDLFYDDDNVWAVCKRCHDTTCQSIEARYGNDAEAIRTAKEAHSPVGIDGYPINR